MLALMIFVGKNVGELYFFQLKANKSVDLEGGANGENGGS